MSIKLLISLLRAKPLLTRKDLAQRYARSLRTIDQWHADGVLPAPIYLKDKRQLLCPFWRPEDILRAEKKLPSLASQIQILRQSELSLTHEQSANASEHTAASAKEASTAVSDKN